MPKKFFTERDIEDMAASGQHTLTICDDVVLTELAFEKANRLGITLVQQDQLPPSAPVRPYLSETVKPASSAKPCHESETAQDEVLRQRIRTAVKAKLGDQVDSALLETIITRVLDNVGIQ